MSDAEGTGIVHIAPGCGQEDFALSKVHGLPVIDPIDQFGIFGEAGVNVLKLNLALDAAGPKK